MFPTWTMEHGGILSMPDFNFILIFDQNDVFDHFLIFTPFLRLIFAIYSETFLRGSMQLSPLRSSKMEVFESLFFSYCDHLK